MQSYCVLTAPGPPGSLFVNEINSTAINVSWSEPDVTNGIITSYEILYSVGNIFDTDAISIPVDVTTNTSYQVIIGGLDPFTMYSVAVRAYTRIGAGNLTNTFSILTDPYSKCYLHTVVCGIEISLWMCLMIQ